MPQVVGPAYPVMPQVVSPAYPVPRPPTSWRRRVAGGLALLLVFSAVAAVVIVHPWTRCGPGVERMGGAGECIGVTDGEVVFAPPLRGVEQAIRTENAWVLAQHRPYVSVAYVATLTPGSQSGAGSIRRQLEGALVSQRAANRAGLVGSAPLIRLLLANDGRLNAQWRSIVDQLRSLVATDHLVAVAGLGLPSKATADEVAALHDEAQIPIVATQLTRGDLNGKGLVTVAPTDGAEAGAAVDYEIKNDAVRGRGALIVKDANPTNVYAATLADQFGQTWAARTHLPSQMTTYRSDLPDVDGIFVNMVKGAALCRPQVEDRSRITPAALPPLVYFAGRASELMLFVKALAAGCDSPDAGPYHVITGPDAAGVPDDEFYARALGHVTVTYTGRASGPRTDSTQAFTQYFVKEFGQLGGDSAGDEQAIVAADAVWVAVNAIRKAAPTQSEVTAGAVLQWLGRPQDFQSGVEGSIELDTCGNRVNEIVPVFEVRPAGASTAGSQKSSWHAGGAAC